MFTNLHIAPYNGCTRYCGNCMHKKPARIETGEGLQERNKLWWTENQVSYDGRNTSQQAEGTREFYDESEARFFRGWLLFAVATKQPRDAGA